MGEPTTAESVWGSVANRLKALAQGRAVLHVEAGTGEVARLLAARDLDVVALEPSAEKIDEGKKRAGPGRIAWRRGCASDSPLGGPYDLVVVDNGGQTLPWDRALPRLSRVASGWFAVTGHDLEIDGGARAFGEVIAAWSADRSGMDRRGRVDQVAAVTRQPRFRRVGHWRAVPQTLMQPTPLFLRRLHRRPGLSREEIGPERLDAFYRAVAEVLDRHHGGAVRTVLSPWVVWGRIRGA